MCACCLDILLGIFLSPFSHIEVSHSSGAECTTRVCKALPTFYADPSETLQGVWSQAQDVKQRQKILLNTFYFQIYFSDSLLFS